MSIETISTLVIEDDPGYTELLTRSLAKLKTPKLEIDTAASLQEAIVKARSKRYDVILLDLCLGETEGIDTLKRARCHISDVPIIVLTGTEDPGLPDEAIRNGAHDYLIKQHADNHVISLAIRYAVDRRRGERSQREQLHFLQSVMDNVPCPLFVKDTGLIYRACNAAFERMLGLQKTAIVGRTAFELFGEGVVEDIRSRELDLLRTQKAQSYELSITRRDGSETYEMLFHEAAYRRGDGSLAGLVGVALDISERKEAERILVENEQYINLILNSVEMGIIVVDAETRKIVDANRSALEMIGASGRDDIADHVCHKFICPSEQDNCPILDKNQKIDHSERSILTIKGEKLCVYKTVVPTVINGTTYLIESFIDITARKKEEEGLLAANGVLAEKVAARTRKLAVTNKRLREELKAHRLLESEMALSRSLFTEGPVVLLRWSPKEGLPVEYASNNALHLFGRSASELASGRMLYADIIHPSDRERVLGEFDAQSDPNSVGLEQRYLVVMADGGAVPVFCRVMAERDESGKVRSFTGYAMAASLACGELRDLEVSNIPILA